MSDWPAAPYIAPNTIHLADALELCKALPDASVDAIVTDPPYFNVLDAAWDRRWKTPQEFIAWLDVFLAEFRRVLKPNGSLFVFAYPTMAARVEVAIADRFNVLNHIVWEKTERSWAGRTKKEAMRSFFPNSERIIFAEQIGADLPYQGAIIDGNVTYWGACEAAKVGIFGEYLASEIARAGVTRKQITALFPSSTGNLTGCVSNWLLGYNLPTPEQYQTMRDYLNAKGGEYLRREYEDLRREYEDLRREYEDLRRPFNLTPHDQYTDVWHYPTAQNEGMSHPAQKPLALMKHIIRAATRPGEIILDPFAGSGTTLVAAKQLGRRYIGSELEQAYIDNANYRLLDPDELPLFARGVA